VKIKATDIVVVVFFLIWVQDFDVNELVNLFLSKLFFYSSICTLILIENYPVVGKINGEINGHKLDSELQGYIYIEDGRIHNSLYNMPLIHSHLQQLIPLFNTINWLFGAIHRFSDPIENGFALTG
jgi:hypothetical protein